MSGAKCYFGSAGGNNGWAVGYVWAETKNAARGVIKAINAYSDNDKYTEISVYRAPALDGVKQNGKYVDLLECDIEFWEKLESLGLVGNDDRGAYVYYAKKPKEIPA